MVFWKAIEESGIGIYLSERELKDGCQVGERLRFYCLTQKDLLVKKKFKTCARKQTQKTLCMAVYSIGV